MNKSAPPAPRTPQRKGARRRETEHSASLNPPEFCSYPDPMSAAEKSTWPLGPGLATKNHSVRSVQPHSRLLGLDVRFLHHAAPFRVVGLDLFHRPRRGQDLGVAAGSVDARDEIRVGAGFRKRLREPLERFARQPRRAEKSIPCRG